MSEPTDKISDEDEFALDERDVMCGRCGSSMGWAECFACGGEGVVDCDPIQCCDEHRCSYCGGTGGWYSCLSSFEYCEDPIVADVPRHTEHWFKIERVRND